MEKVIVDAEMRAKLKGLTEQAMLSDPSGTMLGYFVPPEQFDQMLMAWFSRELTPEERQAIWHEYRSTGGFTTAQAIEYVRSGELQNEG